MEWKDAFKGNEPELEKEILFYYDSEVHLGYLAYNSCRVIKWKWRCFCHGYLDMETEDSGKEIHYWMPLPAAPEEK